MTSLTLVRAARARERERVVDPSVSSSRTRLHLPLPVLSLLGWTGAALGVYAVESGAQGPFDGASRASIALVKIVVILLVGWLYARSARGVPGGVVIVTGIAWLIFSIAADVVTGIGSAGAYQLLGDPAATPPILRNATIFAWLTAPALFARGGAATERGEDSGGHP